MGKLVPLRFPFRLKIALLTATVAALPLIVAGWLLIDVNAREVESANQALQLALVRQVADLADAELARAEGTLDAIAATLGDGSLDDDARLATSLRLLDADPTVDVVAIYGADGALIDRMHAPELEARTPDALDASLREAAAEGRALGAPSADHGVTRVLLVVPIRADGELTGYAAAPWSLTRIQDRVEALSTSQLASREGRVTLVDAAGVRLAHPDVARLASSGAAPDAGARRAPVSGERGDRIETTAGARSAPWFAVASIPTEVAYASLAQMRRIVITTIGAALVLALLAAFFFARRLTAPIEKLVGLTKDLAARRFDRRVQVTTGDELSTLGDALNDAAAALDASEARIREEIAIRGDLGRYLPAEIVEEIVDRQRSMELGGQRRAITVLFADVVAFTPLSDKLPAEEVVAILNELFTLLTDAVFRHGGTVDKFVGDCVMALFGAPAAHEDHAARALKAAQDMLRFLESANAGWKDRYGIEIELAIGVNSGEAVVGNIGSAKRMEYTAIGDVVNVAARLETIARPQQILVTRATVDAAGDAFEALEVGERAVPGRGEPVELLEVRW